MWITRKVQPGTQTGQKIGYPTLNFNVGNFGTLKKPGVYDCEIRISDRTYKGALYFGPRLSHPGEVLEVHVIGFSKKIYGHFIHLRVLKKIRGVIKMNNTDQLKKQIQKDLLDLNE